MYNETVNHFYAGYIFMENVTADGLPGVEAESANVTI